MALTKVDQTMVSDQVFGRRNVVINGAMQVAQRGTQTGLGASSGVYGATDRFSLVTNGIGGRMTIEQSTDAPNGFGNSVKVSLKFFDHYLNPVLMSKKALIQFSKMNDDKYKLYNYINKNNINVTKALLGVWNYSLILSDGPEIENFFLEYLQYSSNLAWERWKKDILKLEKSKFDQVTRDIGAMNRILEKIDPSYDVTKVIVNLNVIKSMYKEREAIMKKNLNFIENMQNPYNEDWILDGPTKYKFNQKFYTLSKFILPVVLSLIIFFLYILIKLTRQDTQN